MSDNSSSEEASNVFESLSSIHDDSSRKSETINKASNSNTLQNETRQVDNSLSLIYIDDPEDKQSPVISG